MAYAHATTGSNFNLPALRRPSQNFLNTVKINHGPARVLGRFFLAAEKTIHDLGIELTLGRLADIAAVQAGQKASWALFPPMLDVRLSPIPEDMSYALIGHDNRGEIVCAQGGRIYDTGTRSLADIAADQSFFYSDNRQPQPGQPTISLTAPAASHITGRFVYSGALWVRPDFRGRRLAGLLPRISRAIALAHWNTAHTIALISDQIARTPLFQLYGYSKVEPMFRIKGLMADDMVGSLMWMDADELVQDLTRVLAAPLPQVDPAVAHGRAQEEPAAVRPTHRHRHA
jgi:hypothetical protein